MSSAMLWVAYEAFSHSLELSLMYEFVRRKISSARSSTTAATKALCEILLRIFYAWLDFLQGSPESQTNSSLVQKYSLNYTLAGMSWVLLSIKCTFKSLWTYFTLGISKQFILKSFWSDLKDYWATKMKA